MFREQNKFSSFKKIFEASCWIELVILLATSASAKHTCDVPSVQVDKATTLTCTFDVDVTVFQKHIVVLHYRDNSPGDPDRVLYYALFQGKFEYLTHPGYTILGNISSTLVVRIDRVTRNHSGKYECHTMPSTPGDAEPCNFWITDVVIDTPTTSKPKDSTILPGKYEDVENLQYAVPLLITLCCVLFLILVGLALAVVIFSRRTSQKLAASKGGYKVNIVADNDSKTKQKEALLA